MEEHKQKLNQLFQQLREVGLSLQSDKCEFFIKELYLGHIISDKGVRPNPENGQYPVQYKNHKKHRQFLNFVGYYRCFIKDFIVVRLLINHLHHFLRKYHSNGEYNNK